MSEASYLCMRRALTNTLISIRRQCRTPTRPQPRAFHNLSSHPHPQRTFPLPNTISIANQTRYFSNSSSRKTTTILHNPRMDDEGNEMRIEISERAARVSHHFPKKAHRWQKLVTDLSHKSASATNHNPIPTVTDSRYPSAHPIYPPPHHRDVGGMPWFPIPDVSRTIDLDRRRRHDLHLQL